MKGLPTKFPFRQLQPFFCAGLLEDPLLFLRFKAKNSNMLVDCGQLDHLSKRTLKSISVIFITHAHMDHFAGFDSFARSVLVSNRIFTLIGPSGIASRLYQKLNAYVWNLTEDYFCCFKVREIDGEVIRFFTLDGSKGFSLCADGEIKRKTLTVYENGDIRVEAEICDHKVPVMIYKFIEKPRFRVDEHKIARLGLECGDWIDDLKIWFYQKRQYSDSPSVIADSDKMFPGFDTPQQLYQAIMKQSVPSTIGYVTDVGYTGKNREVITSLMKGVTLLVCECTYLSDNRQKARESFHLCSDDVNDLIEQLRPGFLLPIHLSKTYFRRSAELYRQLQMPGRCCLLRLPERITHPPLHPEGLIRRPNPED